MKTDDFIAVLAADTGNEATQGRRLWWALGASALVAAVLFFILLGPRPDFLQAVRTIRFDFKFVVALAVAASALFALRRAMRPEMGTKPLAKVLFLAPVLVGVAAILELIVVPSADWGTRWIGHNWLFCMVFIPILSAAPLALLVFTLRDGASTAPARTGALAGLLAGGIGAFFYAAHCPDDSPLFVATWYTIAIAAVTILGFFAGSRLLRW
jgi:hypothetical protein